MQNISNDKNRRSNTLHDLTDFNSKSLATQAEKGEELVHLILVIKKVFDIMVDDIVELSTENQSSKNEVGSHDKKAFEETKARLSEQFDDDQRGKKYTSRMEFSTQKQ